MIVDLERRVPGEDAARLTPHLGEPITSVLKENDPPLVALWGEIFVVSSGIVDEYGTFINFLCGVTKTDTIEKLLECVTLQSDIHVESSIQEHASGHVPSEVAASDGATLKPGDVVLDILDASEPLKVKWAPRDPKTKTNAQEPPKKGVETATPNVQKIKVKRKERRGQSRNRKVQKEEEEEEEKKNNNNNNKKKKKDLEKNAKVLRVLSFFPQKKYFSWPRARRGTFCRVRIKKDLSESSFMVIQPS